MAAKPVLPKISSKAWWTLRSRVGSAPSTKLTPSAVAALLNLSNPKSAYDNIIYPLRRLGLIEEDGSLTARGNKWRVDSTYPEACQDILDDVYPVDLATLVDGEGVPDRQQVETWLQHKGFGQSNVSSMASTYNMIASKTLVSADPSEPRRQQTRAKLPTSPKSRSVVKLDNPNDSGMTPLQPKSTSTPQESALPVVHLDIQIHIPATADSTQIDQIFASMARHLYGR